MARITPGPLPSEGARINPDRDLTNFVRGTQIVEMGITEINVATGGLMFVFSDSNPPPVSAQNRASLWFRRGEGRLYKLDVVPSGTTDTHWISISDRKDMLVLSKTYTPAYALLHKDTRNTEFHSGEGRFERHAIYFASTRASNVLQHGWQFFMHPPVLVAQTEFGDSSSVPDQDVFAHATQTGFTYVRINETRTSGPSIGGVGWCEDTVANPDQIGDTLRDRTTRDRIRSIQAVNGTLTALCYVADSQASSDTNIRMVFWRGHMPSHTHNSLVDCTSTQDDSP